MSGACLEDAPQKRFSPPPVLAALAARLRVGGTERANVINETEKFRLPIPKNSRALWVSMQNGYDKFQKQGRYPRKHLSSVLHRFHTRFHMRSTNKVHFGALMPLYAWD